MESTVGFTISSLVVVTGGMFLCVHYRGVTPDQIKDLRMRGIGLLILAIWLLMMVEFNIKG